MKYVAVLVCLGLAQIGHAQDQSGGYIGAGFGTFDYDEGDGPTAVSDTTTAYQVYGGYRFNDHFAVELGMGRTGDLEADIEDVISSIGPVTLEIDGEYTVYALRVIGLLPFERFSLFGGVGYYSADLNATVSLQGLGEIGWIDGHERGATASAGVQYDFGLDLRSFSLRAEYQWFDFGSDIDASGLNVGLLFRF